MLSSVPCRGRLILQPLKAGFLPHDDTWFTCKHGQGQQERFSMQYDPENELMIHHRSVAPNAGPQHLHWSVHGRLILPFWWVQCRVPCNAAAHDLWPAWHCKTAATCTRPLNLVHGQASQQVVYIFGDDMVASGSRFGAGLRSFSLCHVCISLCHVCIIATNDLQSHI